VCMYYSTSTAAAAELVDRFEGNFGMNGVS